MLKIISNIRFFVLLSCVIQTDRRDVGSGHKTWGYFGEMILTLVHI